MGTDMGIMQKALPVLLKARIVIAIIVNARKAMFIVEDMEKEDMVKSTVTEVLKVNTATVIIVNVSMDMDLLATDIVTDTIELKCDPKWVI